jgi:hypothetical protein
MSISTIFSDCPCGTGGQSIFDKLRGRSLDYTIGGTRITLEVHCVLTGPSSCGVRRVFRIRVLQLKDTVVLIDLDSRQDTMGSTFVSVSECCRMVIIEEFGEMTIHTTFENVNGTFDVFGEDTVRVSKCKEHKHDCMVWSEYHGTSHPVELHIKNCHGQNRGIIEISSCTSWISNSTAPVPQDMQRDTVTHPMQRADILQDLSVGHSTTNHTTGLKNRLVTNRPTLHV